MLRVSTAFVVILAAPVAAVLGWQFAGADRSAAEPATSHQSIALAPATGERRAAAQPNLNMGAAHFVGAGGCAAAACHGESATKETAPSWKNSYSVWFSRRDPHSIAYGVLKSETSKRILWLLDGARPNAEAPAEPWSNAAPERDYRCLTCHSIAPDAATPLPESVLADGVSCEACHGPADSWRASHTTRGWLAGGAARYQSINLSRVHSDDARMWNTKDLVSRANICVRCHVGSADRDVNHDLIAAGHPRLNFEYHAFMEKLPRHWADDRDRERMQADPQSNATKPSEYDARLWAIGQVTSAQAALGLLERRVTRAIKAAPKNQPEEFPTPKGARLGPIAPAWPELSEYNCYACHRALEAPRVARANATERGGRLGRLPWGTWYFSEVQSTLLSPSGSPPLVEELKRLRDTMEQPIVSAEAVANELNEAKVRLTSLAAAWRERSVTVADIEHWLDEFSHLKPPQTWDEATQRYLALEALTESHQKLTNGTRAAGYVEANRLLSEIRELLSFKDDYRSPRLDASQMDELRMKFADLIQLLKRQAPANAN